MYVKNDFLSPLSCCVWRNWNKDIGTAREDVCQAMLKEGKYLRIASYNVSLR